MTQKQQICFKITTDELLDKLNSFKTAQGFKTRSDAINHILVVFFSQDDLENKIDGMLDNYLENPAFLDFLNRQIDNRLLSRAVDSASLDKNKKRITLASKKKVLPK